MSFSTLTPQTPQEPRGFWHKLRRIAQYASRHLLEISLLLYYAAQQPPALGKALHLQRPAVLHHPHGCHPGHPAIRADR
jgi:hypothetical protein